MAANGGTVTVDFAVEVAKANAGITEVVSHLKGFEKQLESLNKVSQQRLKSVEERFGSLETVARRAAQAFSVAVITNFGKQAANAADELGKTADKLGLSTKALKTFEIAGEEAGVALEQTNKLLTESQKRLGEAAAGTGKAAQFIKLLGLNVEELQQLSPDQLFKVYAESINGLSTRSEQLAAANALMGKGAQEAFSLIQAGAPAIDDAAAFVDRFSLALERVPIKQIEQANDALGRLNIISQSAGQQFAAGIAPFVEEFARRVQEATGSTQGLATAGSIVGATLQTAFEIGANAARVAEAAFFGLAAAAANALAHVTEAVVRAQAFLANPRLAFNQDFQKFVDQGVDNATRSLRASAEVNLEKAREALAEVKSIEQIQQGIIFALEASRQKAEQAVAEQAARDAAARAGGVSLGDGGAIELSKQQNFEIANESARAAAEAQKEIARDLSRSLIGEVALRNEAERDAAAARVEMNLRAEQEIAAAKATTTNLALGLLQALGTKNKAFAIAAIVFEKALAIQRLLINNKVAAELAFASQLIPGVPATLATANAAKAAVLAQGYISAGLIAAAGLLQIADVTSGGGRSPAGTALNPGFVNTPPGGGEQVGATTQRTVQVIIQGNVIGNRQFLDELIEDIREAVDDRDAVLISSTSRNAKDLLET